MNKGAGKVRTPPQRTCVGCGAVRGKREMVRVVRTPAGAVVADPTGKLAGRGAYLCAQEECWKLGLAKGRVGVIRFHRPQALVPAPGHDQLGFGLGVAAGSLDQPGIAAGS